MSGPLSRRNFLRTTGLGLASASLPAICPAVTEPYTRVGDSRLKLSLAAYSFRKEFPFNRNKPNPAGLTEKAMQMSDFIRFCAKHNCGGAELTSYFFEPTASDEDFIACRHLAHTTGVAISGTAIGNNFSHPKGSKQREEQMAYTKQWIDRAALMGAPHIRVFAGVHPKGISGEEAERNAAEALEEAADYSASKGIFLGIENHDSISTADRLLRIVKAVKSPWVGVNLDTGNFRSDDPYADMAACAPFAVNVQFKVKLNVGGKRQNADIARIARILREANYQGYFVLEYEEQASAYQEVPKLLEQLSKVCDS